MYNFYSTSECDQNAPYFIRFDCDLKEERLEQISGG